MGLGTGGRRLFGVACLLIITLSVAELARIRHPASTPFLRGAKLAERQGCFACHGAGGLSGIPNPKADSDIPAWNGGTAQMYLEKDEHIREFIKYGKRQDEKDEPDTALIRMPAYGKSLSAGE